MGTCLSRKVGTVVRMSTQLKLEFPCLLLYWMGGVEGSTKYFG